MNRTMFIGTDLYYSQEFVDDRISELKEAEKEIEFERKSKNLLIDDLYKVCEISLKQHKEIERLNNIINEIVNIYESKDTTEDVYFALEELFEKENIIK